MNIKENKEIFDKLKEEFKKQYGFQEVELLNPIVLERDQECGTAYLQKLRINSETDEFEWYKDYWDYGWYQERETKLYGKKFEDVWFEALCQVLGCWKITTYYLPDGTEIYRVEEELRKEEEK